LVFWNIRKTAKGLVVRNLDSNLFAFQSSSLADKEYVLNEGPWSFDGYILLLKQMKGMEVLSSITFSMARF